MKRAIPVFLAFLLYATPLEASFLVSDERIVAMSDESRFEDPRLAAIDDDVLLVWRERPIESESLNGRVLALPLRDDDDQLSSAVPTVVGEGARWGPEVVAWNGVFLVVWGTEYSIYSMRLNRLGVPLETTPRRLWQAPNEIGGIAAASTGSTVMIVGRLESAGPELVIAAYLDREGTVSIHEVTEQRSYFVFPAVTSNGRDFLIAWNDCSLERGAFGMYLDCGVVGRIVSGGPLFSPTRRIFEKTLIIGPGIELASDGDGFLVVADGQFGDERFGKRVTAAGFAPDQSRQGCPVTEAGARELTLTWDGRQYVAAWAINFDWAGDIYGSRLTRDGCSIDGPSFSDSTPLARSTEGEWSPHLLGLGGGTSIYAYEKVVLAPVGDTTSGVSYGIAVRSLSISDGRSRAVRR